MEARGEYRRRELSESRRVRCVRSLRFPLPALQWRRRWRSVHSAFRYRRRPKCAWKAAAIKAAFTAVTAMSTVGLRAAMDNIAGTAGMLGLAGTGGPVTGW